MAEPSKSPSPPNELQREFARPVTRPEDDKGIGPSLGQDVGADHQRAQDKRHNAERA